MIRARDADDLSWLVREALVEFDGPTYRLTTAGAAVVATHLLERDQSRR